MQVQVGHGAIYVKGGATELRGPFDGEQELRLLVETIPTPVWRAAPEGNVEYVNKRALEYLGRLLTKSSAGDGSTKFTPTTSRSRNWLKNLQS